MVRAYRIQVASLLLPICVYYMLVANLATLKVVFLRPSVLDVMRLPEAYSGASVLKTLWFKKNENSDRNC